MKSFEEVYEKIYLKHKDMISKEKSNRNKNLIILIIVILLLEIVYLIIKKNIIIFHFYIMIFIIVFVFWAIYELNRYSRKYKESVIKTLVEELNGKLKYETKNGITLEEYRMAGFDEHFEEFVTEDKIYGRLDSGEKIKMSEIATYAYKITQDFDGERRKVKDLIFRGLYGIVDLRHNINGNISVGQKYVKNAENNKIGIYPEEFNRFYNINAENKLEANRIFTSDLIEKLLNIQKENKYCIEIKIKDNLLFFYYDCGNILEAPVFSDGLSEKLIRKYYRTLFYPMDIIGKLVENINRIYETNYDEV